MPIPWRPQPTEVIQSWINALSEEASDTLNDWETTFIDSCQTRLIKYGSLTEKMQEILERIYAEKTK